jgi:hypothetical protein
MMSRLFKVFVVMMLAAGPALAQSKPAEKTADQLKAEVAALQSKVDMAALQAKLDAAKIIAEGQPVNVRLELTITDQRGATPAISKTVTMTLADRHHGRIRTQGDVRTPQGFRPVILNVDGNASIIQGGRARVMLTIEYRPVDQPFATQAENESTTTPHINETLTVILDDGKPMVVSQSADPVTDRKVKVEAKITLLK